MSVMPVQKIQFTDGMRTTVVGVLGTVTSLTLKDFSQLAAAISATLTALYMLFKCYDWVREKIAAYRAKKHLHKAKHRAHIDSSKRG